MSTPESVLLEGGEREEFLGRGGTGVLSISTTADSPPYAVPVSYGYDASNGVFYFRLAVGLESRKQELLENPVTFVTYGLEDTQWRSVAASGTLERTTDDDISTEALAGLQAVVIPFVDIFGYPPSEVQFEFFRLVPDELSGRKTP